jgi:hypothetical protein
MELHVADLGVIRFPEGVAHRLTKVAAGDQLTQDLLADHALFARAGLFMPNPGQVRTSRERSELKEGTVP